jgi:hypothetical protein
MEEDNGGIVTEDKIFEIKSQKRKRREHGCQRPLHGKQIQVVVLLLSSVAIQYSLVLPQVPDVQYNAVLAAHLLLMLCVIAAWLTVNTRNPLYFCVYDLITCQVTLTKVGLKHDSVVEFETFLVFVSCG